MGIGIVWTKNDKVIKKYSDTMKGGSNSVAELLAIYGALQSIKQPTDKIEIISDSEYALGMIFKNWKAQKHEDLIEKIKKELNRVKSIVKEVIYQHVKGHEDNEFNNLADSLAANASLCLIYE